jgi:2-methylaconitate cis-trans-isomerase PrpF
MMRGGTSRGPFFLASDLPADAAARDALLLDVMGSGHELEVDGIGGGNALTSKVAIVGKSDRPGVDVDYLFAQVGVRDRWVDTSPNCGNMLAAVAPFALEAGLVAAHAGETVVRIRNLNTDKLIDATVQTPGGAVVYAGSARIDGVPGSAAPVKLSFLDGAGAKTGSLFPTGRPSEPIDGVEVTCIDMTVPMVLIPAAALGRTGYESPGELDADAALLGRIEAIRREAGRRMGLGEVAGRVVPKVALVAPPRAGGSIASRYFVPTSCHKAHAITGAIGLATAAVLPGTVASGLARLDASPGAGATRRFCEVEHPSGRLQLELEVTGAGVRRASVIRTARRLFAGEVCLP